MHQSPPRSRTPFHSPSARRNAKLLTPLFHVSKPVRRSIRVQPAIRCYAVDYDRGVRANADEELGVVTVEAIDVVIHKRVNFGRGMLARVACFLGVRSGGL